MSPMFQVEYLNTLGPTGDNNFKKREKKSLSPSTFRN